jgi:hypothetical protein
LAACFADVQGEIRKGVIPMEAQKAAASPTHAAPGACVPGNPDYQTHPPASIHVDSYAAPLSS